MDNINKIIIYNTDDGQTKIEVKIENETVWLSKKQMAELFDKDVRTVNEHIQNVFKEAELAENSVIRNFRKEMEQKVRVELTRFNQKQLK